MFLQFNFLFICSICFLLLTFLLSFISIRVSRVDNWHRVRSYTIIPFAKLIREIAWHFIPPTFLFKISIYFISKFCDLLLTFVQPSWNWSLCPSKSLFPIFCRWVFYEVSFIYKSLKFSCVKAGCRMFILLFNCHIMQIIFL